MCKAETELNFHIMTDCSRDKNLQSSIELWEGEKWIKYDGENTQ